MNLDRAARFALIGLNLFLGASALLGAVAVVPTLRRGGWRGRRSRTTRSRRSRWGRWAWGRCWPAAPLLLRGAWGVLLSLAVGCGIAAFEAVETLVVGLDVWLHALGLTAAPGKGLRARAWKASPPRSASRCRCGCSRPTSRSGASSSPWRRASGHTKGTGRASAPARGSLAGQSGRGRGGPATPAARARPSALAGLALRPVPALLVFARLWTAFLLFLHPWMMGWARRPRSGRWPCRATRPPPAHVTRAITIDAPPARRLAGLLAIGQDQAASTATTGWRISSAATSTTPRSCARSGSSGPSATGCPWRAPRSSASGGSTRA